MMGRCSAACAAVLLLTSLSLVTSRYQARQLFIEQEQLAAQARALDVDWRGLQLARAEYARTARVDEIARGALKMRPITPEHTLYLSASTPAPAAQPELAP